MIDTLAHRLRPHYRHFLGPVEAAGQVLMTGHSHQAWPDVSREAQLEAWDDAARLADGKWGRVFSEILPGFRAHTARVIGSTTPGALALAPNTHDLVYRLISCFPHDATFVTTDGEFHSLRRQLDRLAEDGTRVVHVRVQGLAGEAAGEAPFADRFIHALERTRPTLAALSAVMFGTSERVLELPRILSAAAALGVPVLVDTYHAAHVVELDVAAWPGEVFVVGGGYKYAEHGEGACWMHVPASADRLRPRHTGWFADFAGLEHGHPGVGYASGGDRFFGSTFDPTAYYRALRVLEWMEAQGLSVPVLRAQSLAQTQHLIDRAEASGRLTVATPREPERRGGFVALHHPRATELSKQLAERGVRTDARGPYLRFGPAPYTTVAELDRAVDTLLSLV